MSGRRAQVKGNRNARASSGAVPLPDLLDHRGWGGLDRSHPRRTAQAVARRVIGREAEALRETVKDFFRWPHLPSFGLRDSFIEFRALLRRHPVIERAHDGSLVELLGDLALLRLVESLEQFDDLGLGLGHDGYITPAHAAVESVRWSSVGRNPALQCVTLTLTRPTDYPFPPSSDTPSPGSS